MFMRIALCCWISNLTVLAFATFAADDYLQMLSKNEVEQLLNRIADVQPRTTIKLKFHETRTSSLFKTPLTANGILYFNPPNQFRKEITSTPKSLVISNGKQIWMYYPAFDELETYSLESNNPIGNLLSNFLSCLDIQKAQEIFSIQAWKTNDGYKLLLNPKRRKPPFDVSIELQMNTALRPKAFIIRASSGDITRIDLSSESTFTAPSNFFNFTH